MGAPFTIDDPGLPPETTSTGTGNDIARPNGNAFLAQQRAPFKAELEQDPDLKHALAALISKENPGAGTAVAESLFNRTAFMRDQGHNVTLAQMMGADNPEGSFYGPVRRGELGAAHAQLQQNPTQLAALHDNIDEALGGSNYTRGHTDQGSRGDPNYEGGGTGVNINGERFNDWNGGGADSARWRQQQQTLAFGGTPDEYQPEGYSAQPQPQPNPGSPKGPRDVGPYPDFASAMAAKPGNSDAYSLVSAGGGAFSWVPKSKLPPSGPGTPSPGSDPEQVEKIANRAIANGPQTFSGQLSHLFANIGPTFRSGLAGSLDLPVELVGKGLNAISGATGLDALRNQWGTPVGDWMKSHNWNMTPLYDDGWGATVGSGIGYGVGSALPFMAAGALAEPFAGASKLAAGVARWMGNPGRSIGAAANEAFIAAGAGIGGQEAHELYKGATGREGDIGDVMTQLVGGGLWNVARIGVLSGLEKSIGGAWAQKYATATQGGAVLDARTGGQLADQVLHANLSQKLSEAAQDVAAFHKNPADSASYLAAQSQRAAQAVDAFAGGSRQDERALWALVNTKVQVDYSKVNSLWSEARRDHFQDTLRDPADWPKQFDNILGGGKGTAEQPGLANVDTLGRGQDLRSRLNYAIEKELSVGASGRVVNAPYVGYLQKTRNALNEAMESASGATPEEIQNLQRAQLFSARRAGLMESPEMRSFMASGNSSALKSLIRQGSEGADAVKLITGAAAQRYGAEGLLTASQDSMRQMYTDAVAPNGYVNQQAHAQFMKAYGPYLNTPAFASVRNEFEQAAKSEANVNAVVGFGKPSGYGKAGGQLDVREAAAQNYLEAPLDLTLHHLEGRLGSQTLATNKVIDQLQEGWSPSQLAANGGQTPAQQGLMHAIAGKVLGDPGYAAKNQSMLEAFDKINPGFSQRALDISSPSNMAGIARWTKDLTASWIGARMGGKLGEGLGSSLVLAGRGAEGARAVLGGALDKAFKISTAAIVDPQANSALSRLLGKVPSTLAQKAKDVLLFHSYVPGFLADNINNPDTQAGSGAPGSAPTQNEFGHIAGTPEWYQDMAHTHQQLFRGGGGQPSAPSAPPAGPTAQPGRPAKQL